MYIHKLVTTFKTSRNNHFSFQPTHTVTYGFLASAVHGFQREPMVVGGMARSMVVGTGERHERAGDEKTKP
jgi:hypothetical protein